ncbi:T-cell surface glycoprotein CD1a-like isoform X1 [Mustela lutreola]|uniref:T-cell surface glycoprotein CD1a-like isoform X1 n=1 Tax=Mustela lutreola TaxID=9666 RepID=UPI00279741AE|nr:T-cell surface glycoprotein CD1a-like isoform X1 [Mustela lutreola]
MLFLQLVLLVVLLPDGDSEDDFQKPICIRIILTTSFYNHSWMQSQGSAWLNELQTHAWNNKTGAFIFLQRWPKDKFCNKELMEVDELFSSYYTGFLLKFHDHGSQWQLEYPFQVQLIIGCELHFGEASVGFMRIAYQGSELVSFWNMTWWPSPTGGSRGQQVCRLLNQDHEDNELMHTFIIDSCPLYLSSFLDAGKADLQRKVRPEAWLSTGPSPGPGHLLLVCHVSGFYPKPVWVMWMRGEQEQQGTQRGDVLPHADGTWYLQVSLDVKTREAADLLCQVRHSSLGGQDLVLYWEQSHTTALDFLVVIMPLVLLAGLTLWLCRHWKTHWRLQCTGFPFEQDPSSPGSGTYLNPTQQ